jgi:hypothetical protein
VYSCCTAVHLNFSILLLLLMLNVLLLVPCRVSPGRGCCTASVAVAETPCCRCYYSIILLLLLLPLLLLQSQPRESLLRCVNCYC